MDSILDWTQSSHDPGGRVKLPIKNILKSEAEFSPCYKYRRTLLRVWDTSLPRIAFIGMNPSVADVNIDDPTVRKETDMARSWGYGSLVKLNVMDYRATKPADLLKQSVVPQTQENLDCIKNTLAQVHVVVAAWGKLGTPLRDYEINVRNLLKNSSCQIYCLGLNLDHSPKHPLYLKKNTQLQLFDI